ncbi:MAG: hypothetical protein HYR60_33895 [Acidobacteria bacterium]|nr:hypothetical protein [Acidobacteriota bacterium]
MILAGLFVAAQGLWAADCARTQTGFLPLDDPFFPRNYLGFRGGLYPDGANQRPAAHEAAGLRLAAEVRPRNAAGAPDDSNGRIVLLSIGMSNATQEFSAFQALAARDPEINPSLTLVDGAQGGWSADRLVADGTAYWATVDQRLRAGGVTAAQVQAVWLKEADAGPSRRFPEDARQLQGELRTIVLTLRSRYPNLRLVYLASRIYGGYAASSLNPEPYAYQSGFAVKWLIEQQIQGDPELPWLSWGPYLWADGTEARPDGLMWNCEDLAEDGTHPSVAGRQKVARMLLQFFKGDTTARPWFARRGPAPSKPAALAMVNAASFAPQVTPGSIATLYGSDLAPWAVSAELPLPTSLAGTRVLVGGVPALLYYVSPGQVNLVLPKAPLGAEVIVRRESEASEPMSAQLAIYAPGLFASGGRAAALHEDGRPIAPSDPARHGETIQLFFTGAGVRNPLSLRPDILPVVRIGGVSVPVDYSGGAPGYPGLDQINAVVLPEVPTGDAVPVTIEFAAERSNAAWLSIG